MDIRLMREFLILARTENYLEAAELLFVSQPTLSRHIMTLENELGVPLFERTTRYVRLSRYGKMLVPYAQQFLELSGQFNNLLLAEKRAGRCSENFDHSRHVDVPYHGRAAPVPAALSGVQRPRLAELQRQRAGQAAHARVRARLYP